MGAYEFLANVPCCFGVNHLRIATESDKKGKGKGRGSDIDIKGTFNPAVPIDLAVDDVTFFIDDGQGNVLDFFIPAGSFKPEGKPEHQKFKYDSPKGSVPDIKAKFDVLKCTFDLKVKKLLGTTDVTGPNMTVTLQAGPNLAQETVQVQAKGKHKDYLEHRKTPKLQCCPK